MQRSSRFANAAFIWLMANSPSKAVSSEDLWKGLQKSDPTLTAVSDKRKTPRTTCMRDLRHDSQQRFIVNNRTIALAQAPSDGS